LILFLAGQDSPKYSSCCFSFANERLFKEPQLLLAETYCAGLRMELYRAKLLNFAHLQGSAENTFKCSKASVFKHVFKDSGTLSNYRIPAQCSRIFLIIWGLKEDGSQLFLNPRVALDLNSHLVLRHALWSSATTSVKDTIYNQSLAINHSLLLLALLAHI
jgi:hypothetical protein